MENRGDAKVDSLSGHLTGVRVQAYEVQGLVTPQCGSALLGVHIETQPVEWRSVHRVLQGKSVEARFALLANGQWW